MNKTIKKETGIGGKALPRVLIVGQTFTTDTGGGITLCSLFKGWPADKIAVAVESKEGIDFERSFNYFRVGYKELKMPFPFSVFQRKTKSGPISPHARVGDVHVKPTGKLKGKIKACFDQLLHYSGLFFWIYGNEQVSGELVDWINEFKPDLLYYQPNSYKSIGFALELNKRLRLPMITHVMDDWFSFAVRPGLLKKFWLKKLNGRVAALFAGSSLHLSICQYMSDEYLKRYGYHFFPFHHTVDPELWDGGREDPRPLHRPVHLLYAGRLGNGVDQTLLKVCRVVEKMGDEGQALVLEIQTRDLDQSFAETLKGFRHVSVTPPISYAKLPEKFASADILLIPCDFEGAGLTFIRYSMPTKVSEYMATGTPILVVGPPGTALVEYAKKGWAGLCLSGEEMKIARAIEELISSPAHRQHVIQTARRLVLENHDEKTVINQFRQKLVLLGSLVSSVN